MAQRTLRVDLTGITQRLPEFLDDLARRQLPFATALTLTRIAKDAKEDLTREIPKRFDRPTPFTQRSVYMKAATKKTQSAEVWLKDFIGKGTPAAKYLAPQIFGGARDLKRFERRLDYAGILPKGRFVMPTRDTPMDRYGNISGPWLNKVLSELGAQGDQYQNTTDASIKRKGRRRGSFSGYTYFRPDGERSGAARLLFERHSFAMGEAKRAVLAFVKTTPRYKVRFPFFDLGNARTIERWDLYFKPALEEAIATSAKKSAKSFEAMPVDQRLAFRRFR